MMTTTVSWRHHVLLPTWLKTKKKKNLSAAHCTLCLLLTLIKISVNEMGVIHLYSFMRCSHSGSWANPFMQWDESCKSNIQRKTNRQRTSKVLYSMSFLHHSQSSGRAYLAYLVSSNRISYYSQAFNLWFGVMHKDTTSGCKWLGSNHQPPDYCLIKLHIFVL